MRPAVRSLPLFLFLASTITFAQAPPPSGEARPSLGDAARVAREKKAEKKASIVLDNDTAGVAPSGPLPDIGSKGRNNSGDIIAALERYMSNHKKPETEAMLHSWYDQQDSAFMFLVSKADAIRAHANDPGNSRSWQSNDGSLNAKERADTEARSRQNDSKMLADINTQLFLMQNVLSDAKAAVKWRGIDVSWFILRKATGEAYEKQ